MTFPGNDNVIRNSDLPAEVLATMEGPKPPDNYEGNGCSDAPDYIGAVDLRSACHCHDYQYGLGGTEKNRADADYRFYRNLRRCGLGSFLANRYFSAVRLFGHHAFNYDAESEPKVGFCFYCQLILSLFWRW